MACSSNVQFIFFNILHPSYSKNTQANHLAPKSKTSEIIILSDNHILNQKTLSMLNQWWTTQLSLFKCQPNLIHHGTKKDTFKCWTKKQYYYIYLQNIFCENWPLGKGKTSEPRHKEMRIPPRNTSDIGSIFGFHDHPHIASITAIPYPWPPSVALPPVPRSRNRPSAAGTRSRRRHIGWGVWVPWVATVKG